MQCHGWVGSSAAGISNFGDVKAKDTCRRPCYALKFMFSARLFCLEFFDSVVVRSWTARIRQFPQYWEYLELFRILMKVVQSPSCEESSSW